MLRRPAGALSISLPQLYHEARSAVAPEKAAAATWVSGSPTFKPHGARSTLSRTGTCASAWPMPQSLSKGRAGPERHCAQRLHPQPRRGRPAVSSRSQLRVVRVVGAPSSPCCGASACRLRPLLVPSLTSRSPSASGSLLLCCFGFGFFLHLRAPSSPLFLRIPIPLALCPFV